MRSKSAFSYPELMIALTILAATSAGLASFLIDSGWMIFHSTEKLEINQDIRQFTQEMTNNARASNAFYMYKSIDESDRNDNGDQLSEGQSGDLLLLLFTEPYPTPSSSLRITRAVIYYREADSENEGPVMRLERDYDPDSYPLATTPEESIIADLISNGTPREVIELSRGLAEGKLFYNYQNRSVIIRAEILHGNAAKEVTNTYNYTVSPKG